jgi:hypothetical protein
MRKGKSEAQMGCALSEMHRASAAAEANATSTEDHRGVELRNNMAGA